MKIERYLIILILIFHAVLLAWVGYRNSPTWDEVCHLPAGLFIWNTGTFNAYSVNPPLARTIAAVPLLFVSHEEDWQSFFLDPTRRSEFDAGRAFVRANGERSFFLYTLGRWMCIPFSLLAGWICYRWAKELYGIPSGFLALAAWCFSPLVLGHASLVTPDSPTAALGVTACYCFWHWLKKPDRDKTFWTGLMFGLAQCTKFTFIVWYGLFPLIWLIWFYMSRKEPEQMPFRKQTTHFIALLMISIIVINFVYSFEGSFKRLDSYSFASKTFIQITQHFKDAQLGWIPVPLPVDYVRGIDIQKIDFEVKLHSYLRGEWRHGGWYHYYIYAYFIKEPLGILWLLVLATYVGIFRRGYASTYRDEFLLLFIPLSLLAFVSSQTGFNHHLRYLLPAYPFVYIWLSKLVKSFLLKEKIAAIFTAAGIAWFIASSLYYYPHSMSYFNELVGGPKNGHYHLGNSNIDWGQDLLYLKRWLDKHPEVEIDCLLYDMPLVDVEIAGISVPKINPVEPREGWYVISVNQIHKRNGRYKYFLEFEPFARIGYSMNVYHITHEEAKRVRHKMGFTEIDPRDYPIVEDETTPSPEGIEDVPKEVEHLSTDDVKPDESDE